MTLCVVWFEQEMLCLASDSRLSLGSTGGSLDTAVKVVKVPLTCYGEVPPGKSSRRVVFSSSVGIALIGNFITSYAALLNIIAVIEDLQLQPDRASAVSFQEYIPLVTHWYQNAARASCEVLGPDGIAEFILCGTEQTSDAMRAYHFSLDASRHPIEARVQELDLTSGPLFFGSGRDAALRYLEKHPRATPWHVLRGVIGDPAVRAVGGHIQFGSLREYGFVLDGIVDYDVDPVMWQFTTHQFRAGLSLTPPLDLVSQTGTLSNLHAIAPFSAEIGDLRAAGFTDPSEVSVT